MRKYEISEILSTRIVDLNETVLEYRLVEQARTWPLVQVFVNDREVGFMTYSIKNNASIYIHRMKNATIDTPRPLKHIGTLLFEYAFKMSIAKGLGGRVTLYAASRSTCPACYFRMGFRTKDFNKNAEFLALLEKKVLLTREDCSSVTGDMHLPEENIKEKLTQFGLSKRELPLLSFLFANRPDPDARKKHEFTLLRNACLLNNAPSVLSLISSGVDVNYDNGKADFHLNFCLTCGHWLLAKRLLELGANLNREPKIQLESLLYSKKVRGASKDLDELIKYLFIKYLNLFITKINQVMARAKVSAGSPRMFWADDLLKQIQCAERLMAIINQRHSVDMADINQDPLYPDELKILTDYALKFELVHDTNAVKMVELKMPG